MTWTIIDEEEYTHLIMICDSEEDVMIARIFYDSLQSKLNRSFITKSIVFSHQSKPFKI